MHGICFSKIIDLYQYCFFSPEYTSSINERYKIMGVFGELFNDLTGWLTIGIILFMLVMMAYLFSMFINKSAKNGK